MKTAEVAPTDIRTTTAVIPEAFSLDSGVDETHRQANGRITDFASGEIYRRNSPIAIVAHTHNA